MLMLMLIIMLINETIIIDHTLKRKEFVVIAVRSRPSRRPLDFCGKPARSPVSSS